MSLFICMGNKCSSICFWWTQLSCLSLLISWICPFLVMTSCGGSTFNFRTVVLWFQDNCLFMIPMSFSEMWDSSMKVSLSLQFWNSSFCFHPRIHCCDSFADAGMSSAFIPFRESKEIIYCPLKWALLNRQITANMQTQITFWKFRGVWGKGFKGFFLSF